MEMWADIPTDILLYIFERLNFLNDIIVVGAVCKSWRSTTVLLAKIQIPPKTPWLMLAEENKRGVQTSEETVNNTRGFFSLLDDKVYNLNLPELTGRKCYGIGFGWLLTMGSDLKINLIHPLSRHQINLPLPQLSFLKQGGFPYHRPYHVRNFYVHKAAASANPWDSDAQDYNRNCVIMIIYGGLGRLAFAKLGDTIWTRVQIPPRAYCDITYYKGKFYAVDYHLEVFACNIDGDKVSMATPIAYIPNWVNFFSKKYLIESSEKLFLVCRIHDMGGDKEEYITKYFQLLELKPKGQSRGLQLKKKGKKIGLQLKKKWKNRDTYNKYKFEEVETLGDQAFFVGNSASFSLTASNSNGCKANCIYFTDDMEDYHEDLENGGGFDMGVYNIEDDRIESHYTGESLSYFCTPRWYI